MKETCDLIIILLMTILLGGVAFASESKPDLYEITGYEGTQGIVSSDYEKLNTTKAETVFQILLEDAGYCDENIFGIYSFTDIDGMITVDVMHQIFKGADVPGSEKNISGINSEIGFYLTTPQGYTYYSHTSLNPDREQHMLLFSYSDVSDSESFVVACEDLYGLGDCDYNDLVVKASNVHGNPEPATILSFFLAGLGLAFRKMRK